MTRTVTGSNIHLFGPGRESLKTNLMAAPSSTSSATSHRPQSSWLPFSWGSTASAPTTQLSHLVSDSTELAATNVIVINHDSEAAELGDDLIPRPPAASTAKFILVVLNATSTEEHPLKKAIETRYGLSFASSFYLTPITDWNSLRTELGLPAVSTTAAAPVALRPATPPSPARDGLAMGRSRSTVAAEAAPPLRLALTNFINAQLERSELKNTPKAIQLASIQARITDELGVSGTQALIQETRAVVSAHRWFISRFFVSPKSLIEFNKIFTSANLLVSETAVAEAAAASATGEATAAAVAASG